MTGDLDLLQTIICGATAFELLRAGLELDVFEHLESGDGMDLTAVAKAIGTEEQPARVLLLGLASLKLIGKEGSKYVNAPVAKTNLLRAGPGYLGKVVEVQAKIVNPGIIDLTESIRRNTNVGLRYLSGTGTTLYERLNSNPELQQVFYNNLGDVSGSTFPIAIEAFDFSRLRHVVDVGGGDGTNSIVLAKRYPHLEVTLFDQGSTEIAKKKAEAAGVGDRVHVWVGDFFKGPFPEGIDGIVLSHIFEMWSIERNIGLLRDCYAALPPGGTVLVYNFVSKDDNTGTLAAAFMSAYFLALASGEGMVYSPDDMEAAIREAGFSGVERYEDNVGFEHALFVATK